MKHLKYLLIALGLLIASQAEANNCFWVGGTGTWDNAAITHWAPTTGAGATGCSTSNAAPTTGDSVTFDGSSGGGTVTAATTINNLSLANITTSAFTGTVDFSANNPNLTISTSWLDAASAAHTVNLGSGTFTFSSGNGNIVNFTTSANLTLNAGTSTILISASANNIRTFVSAGKTYNKVTIANTGATGPVVNITGAPSIGTLTLTAPVAVASNSSTGPTVTSSFVSTGTSSNQIFIQSGNTSAQSWTVPAGTVMAWTAVNNVTFATNSPTCNNCFDLKGNSNITINAPSVGGGGHIIGG